MSAAMLASSAPLPEKAGMAVSEPHDQAHRAIEAVFRIERARLIAALARMTRDVDRAEELAQEALLIALTEWPASGVPDKPGARSEEHTSEPQSLMRISYAVFCLKKTKHLPKLTKL